jgi:hypothetical protein
LKILVWDGVVSRMLWKFPSGSLRACEIGSDQAARSIGIASRD